MRLSTRLLLTALAVLLFASVLGASVSFTPPSGKKMYVASLTLEPASSAGKATATATMVCQADLTKGMLTLQATGLDPKQAYTARLVKQIPAKGAQKARTQVTGLGKAPYQLKVTDKGFGNLMANLANCKDAVTQRLEIVAHPNGNPKDTNGTTVVFTGDLAKMLQGKKM